MAQQTAVEWLIEQLHSESYQNAFGRTYVSPVIIDEAKAMEKEQIKMAITDWCFLDGIEDEEHYYNLKYGSNNQI